MTNKYITISISSLCNNCLELMGICVFNSTEKKRYPCITIVVYKPILLNAFGSVLCNFFLNYLFIVKSISN